MSYSNITDAFNINSNFENTVRGLNSFNPGNNTLENIRSGYSSNLNSSKSQFETEYYPKSKILDQNYEHDYPNYSNPNIPYPMIDSMFASSSSSDNTSWESLNGTDLLSGRCDYDDNNKKNNLKINLSSRKLTHRECINIYNNPDSYQDTLLTQALKHISKCKMCKDEIKNTLLSLENEKKNNLKKNLSESNSFLSENDSNLVSNKVIKNQNSTKNTFRKNTNDSDPNTNLQNLQNEQNNFNKITNAKIESELKLLNDKINGESNLKYQNAMLQNNLSKYLEDLEEKKKINYKLDKIMELVNLNLSKTNKLDSLFGYGEYPNLNNNIIGSASELSQISPQLLSNLLKLTQQNNQHNQNIQSTIQTGWESYLLYIGITIIILLLVVDIIIRLSYKSN
jgi:hypothetical protein